MKKTLIFCQLFILSHVFSQEQEPFVNEFQLFTGFNNVGWGNHNYGAKATAEHIYPESQDHIWTLTYPEDPNMEEFGFFDFNLPSFYIDAIAGHKLPIPHCTWRFGLNFIHSSLRMEDYSAYGLLEHSWTYNDTGGVAGYRQSTEYLHTEFEVGVTKISAENAFYIRSGTPASKRSVYFGVSTQLGFSRSQYYYRYKHNMREYDIDSTGMATELFSTSVEFKGDERGKIGPYASANLLFGYNRRLGKRKAALKTVHLFAEFKPGFCTYYAPELRAWKSTYNGFWSLVGFRYTFEDDGPDAVPEKSR